MAGVFLRLGLVACGGPPAHTAMMPALVLLLRTRLNSAWLVLGGAVAGIMLGLR